MQSCWRCSRSTIRFSQRAAKEWLRGRSSWEKPIRVIPSLCTLTEDPRKSQNHCWNWPHSIYTSPFVSIALKIYARSFLSKNCYYRLMPLIRIMFIYWRKKGYSRVRWRHRRRRKTRKRIRCITLRLTLDPYADTINSIVGPFPVLFSRTQSGCSDC